MVRSPSTRADIFTILKGVGGLVRAVDTSHATQRTHDSSKDSTKKKSKRRLLPKKLPGINFHRNKTWNLKTFMFTFLRLKNIYIILLKNPAHNTKTLNHTCPDLYVGSVGQAAVVLDLRKDARTYTPEATDKQALDFITPALSSNVHITDEECPCNIV